MAEHTSNLGRCRSRTSFSARYSGPATIGAPSRAEPSRSWSLGSGDTSSSGEWLPVLGGGAGRTPSRLDQLPRPVAVQVFEPRSASGQHRGRIVDHLLKSPNSATVDSRPAPHQLAGVERPRPVHQNPALGVVSQVPQRAPVDEQRRTVPTLEEQVARRASREARSGRPCPWRVNSSAEFESQIPADERPDPVLRRRIVPPRGWRHSSRPISFGSASSEAQARSVSAPLTERVLSVSDSAQAGALGEAPGGRAATQTQVARGVR